MPPNVAPKRLKIFYYGRAVFVVLFFTVKGIWLLFWSLYQLALGAILVGIVFLLFKVNDYLAWTHIWDLRHTNPATTSFIESEKERLTADTTVVTGAGSGKPLVTWEWAPLDSIPERIREAAIVAEDAKFYDHQGFDLEQIEYAVVANHQAGKRARGASTITQQVAKNLFLSKDKELSRKLREAALCLLLEHYLTKDRILEIYLNIAQFDEGVFGIKSGSLHHFKKELHELTAEEAINLVCMLPSPTQWNPKRPTNAYLQHKRLVTRNMALYKGYAKSMDMSQPDWQLEVYARLAGKMEEERWRSLRSRPLLEIPAPADSGSDTAKAPPPSGPGIPTRGSNNWSPEERTY